MCSFRSLIFTRTSSCGHTLSHSPLVLQALPISPSALPSSRAVSVYGLGGQAPRQETGGAHSPFAQQRAPRTAGALSLRTRLTLFLPLGDQTLSEAQRASVLVQRLATLPESRVRIAHPVAAQAHWAPIPPPPVLDSVWVHTANGPQQSSRCPCTSFRSGSILYTDWSWFRSLIAIAIWPP